MGFRLKLISALVIIVSLTVFAYADTLPARPQQYTVDLAGIVDDASEAKLNRLLNSLEAQTGIQFLVLTVQSTDGASIDDFALQAVEKWTLGQKGKDNGMLLVVSLSDRNYRIEVGYGLEGIMPDSLAGSIGRQYAVPYFKNGRYTEGIENAVYAVLSVFARETGFKPDEMPSNKARKNKPGIKDLILLGLGGLVFLYMLIKHPRLLLLMILFSGRRHSSWGGGGGFGSGGSGGFGGGGGGGFGGGGSSGSW